MINYPQLEKYKKTQAGVFTLLEDIHEAKADIQKFREEIRKKRFTKLHSQISYELWRIKYARDSHRLMSNILSNYFSK